MHVRAYQFSIYTWGEINKTLRTSARPSHPSPGAGPGDDDELSEDPESEAATDDNEVEVEEANASTC